MRGLSFSAASPRAPQLEHTHQAYRSLVRLTPPCSRNTRTLCGAPCAMLSSCRARFRSKAWKKHKVDHQIRACTDDEFKAYLEEQIRARNRDGAEPPQQCDAGTTATGETATVVSSVPSDTPSDYCFDFGMHSKPRRKSLEEVMRTDKATFTILSSSSKSTDNTQP